MNDDDPELEDLRSRIDTIDRDLLEILARRREAVEAVADWKQRAGVPVFHPAREQDLISERRDLAIERDLDPDFVEDLFRLLVRHSRVAQGNKLATRSVRPGARVLVVGGNGAMGRSLVHWFRQADYEARVLDQDDWPRVEELSRDVDLAILAVPIEVTTEVAWRLGPSLPANCVLCDITSIKEEPVGAMLAAHLGPVLGMHPMFGPATRSFDRQVVVCTPGRGKEAYSWVIDQLEAWGAVCVMSEAKSHDDAMGIVQALRHFATFALGRFLASQKIDLQRTLDLSSPIYRLELGMVGRLFAQDPGLYSEIVFATPARRQLLEEYVESLQQTLPLVRAGDRAAFTAEFARVADWFGPFSDQAMRESSFLIEKLVERF